MNEPPPPFRIFTLDTKEPHSGTASTLRTLLLQVAAHKGSKIHIPNRTGTQAKNLPQLQEDADSGVYLLEYARRFLDNPNQFVKHVTASGAKA